MRTAPDPSLEVQRHYHNNLIDEAEEDLQSLSWPELMFAGGVAGVAAWLVSYPDLRGYVDNAKASGHIPCRCLQDTYASHWRWEQTFVGVVGREARSEDRGVEGDVCRSGPYAYQVSLRFLLDPNPRSLRRH